MPELSPSEINLISRYIKHQDITFSHLPDDLIDHFCCEVENEMNSGMSFREAYLAVRQKIGPRRLNEIQEETLYAIDTKYRKMKNTMKISAVAGTILFGFASLFKIMHWPLAGILMTLGALTLALVFLPSALVVLWKESHSHKRLFLLISAFFAAFFLIAGILFKVQHWPGASIMITLAGISAVIFLVPVLLLTRLRDTATKEKKPVYVFGAIGIMIYITGFLFKIQHWPLAGVLLISGFLILFAIVFPWYTRISWKNENYIRTEFIYLVIGSLAIVIPAALTMTNVQNTYNQGYVFHLKQENILYDYLNQGNMILLSSGSDSANCDKLQMVHDASSKMISVVNSIEAKMIGTAEGKPVIPVEGPYQVAHTEKGQKVSFEKLSKPFHPLPVKKYLLPGTSSRSQLENALAEYKKSLAVLISKDEMINLDKTLDISTYLPQQAGENEKISMLIGLHSLAMLKNAILTVESIVIKNLDSTK
ncbi:MAG: hypothetical protein GYA41_10505 [Bacteroidales bacterium]|nr:hypothetical protein [Bacteroidales bacterium]